MTRAHARHPPRQELALLRHQPPQRGFARARMPRALLGFKDGQRLFQDVFGLVATRFVDSLDASAVYEKAAAHKASVLSFVMEDVHPHDIGTILDQQGVAIRTGHHCTQPIMNFFDVPGTVRASFAFYNTKEEIDALIDAVKKAQRMLG